MSKGKRRARRRATAKASKLTKPLQRKRTGALRVGCLAWSQQFTDEPRWLSSRELVRSLELLNEQEKINADLILCSGAAVWDDGTKPHAITAAAGGAAVLSEWRDEEDDPAQWWLATQKAWRQVRHDQHFTDADEVRAYGHRTLKELAQGWGTIRFEGEEVALVLLLCNEARVLGRDPSASIVAPALAKRHRAPKVFESPWALLHPSHRPYGSTSIHRGWGLVGETRRKGTITPALFEKITGSRGARSDGTHSPVAVFHAGPWEPAKDEHQRVSGCAFHGGQRQDSPRPTFVEGLVQVRYAEFELPPQTK